MPSFHLQLCRILVFALFTLPHYLHDCIYAFRRFFFALSSSTVHVYHCSGDTRILLCPTPTLLPDIYGHNDAVFSSLPFAHSLTTYTTTTDDIGQLLCAVHNSLLLQHDTCGLRMFLIVLFTSCVITPIDSCFGVPVICPVHISYLVLHCWGRTPSFTIFTSPLQL